MCIFLTINICLCCWAPSFLCRLCSRECGCNVLNWRPDWVQLRTFCFTQTPQETRPYWDPLRSFQLLFQFSPLDMPPPALLFSFKLHLLPFIFSLPLCSVSLSVLRYMFGNRVFCPLDLPDVWLLLRRKAVCLSCQKSGSTCWTCCSCQTGLHYISGQHNCHFSFGLSSPVSLWCPPSLSVSRSAACEPLLSTPPAVSALCISELQFKHLAADWDWGFLLSPWKQVRAKDFCVLHNDAILFKLVMF